MVFLDELKVDKINGIGKFTKEMLEKILKINTIGDLKKNMNLIFLSFKEKSFKNLFRLSFGLSIFDCESGPSNVKSRSKDVSVKPTNSLTEISNLLWEAAEDLSKYLERKDTLAEQLTIKIRFYDFRSLSRQILLKVPVGSQVQIYNSSLEIVGEVFGCYSRPYYKTFSCNRKIGMIGVRVSGFVDRRCVGLLDRYWDEKMIGISRECPVCGMAFFVETSIFVEKHVDECLKIPKRRGTLDCYISREV